MLRTRNNWSPTPGGYSKLGLVDYLGHVSARTAESNVVIKPKHSTAIRGMNKLSADQMITVNMAGNLLEGESRPPAEVFIHTEIYKARPDVNAVVHTHQHSATIMGIISAPTLPLLHIPASYVGPEDVGLWPCPMLVTNADLGSDLAKSLGDKSFCHLQGPGIVSVGANVEEAVVKAVMLEELAVANLAVMASGRAPRIITVEEREELEAFRGPVAGRWAYLKELLES